MPGFLKLGYVLRIRVRAHFTLFVLIAFIAVILFVQYNGTYSTWQIALLSLSAAIIYFSSVLLRSLFQALTALKLGIKVKSINLFAFGGFYRISEEANRPLRELLLAGVGFFVSLILSGIFYLFFNIYRQNVMNVFTELLQWSVYFNFMLLIINLLPGMPLDAGRILRGILWAKLGDYVRALGLAAKCGRWIAVIFMVGGVIALVLGNLWITGVLLIIAGACILFGALQIIYQSKIYDALHGITARRLMKETYTLINPQITIALAHDYVLSSGQSCFAVVEEGHLLGLVTLRDLKVPKNKRQSTTISKIMTPLNKLSVAKPDTAVAPLFEEMNELNVRQIPIMEDDGIVGLLYRDDLNRFLVAKSILG